jgi:hypothetical protein
VIGDQKIWTNMVPILASLNLVSIIFGVPLIILIVTVHALLREALTREQRRPTLTFTPDRKRKIKMHLSLIVNCVDFAPVR